MERFPESFNCGIFFFLNGEYFEKSCPEWKLCNINSTQGQSKAFQSVFTISMSASLPAPPCSNVTGVRGRGGGAVWSRGSGTIFQGSSIDPIVSSFCRTSGTLTSSLF